MGNPAQNAAEARRLARFFEREFAKIEKAISQFIIREINKGTNIDKAVRLAFVESGLDNTMREIFEKRIVESAAIGLGILPTAITADVADSMRKSLIDKAWTGDKLSLGKRISKANRRTQRAVSATIKRNFRTENNYTKLTNKLSTFIEKGRLRRDEVNSQVNRILKATSQADLKRDLKKFQRQVDNMSEMQFTRSRLGKSYQRFINAVDSGKPERIAKAIANAVKVKNRATAQRIAVTELNRAYHDGFFAVEQNNDDVVAYRWNLSSAHKIYDICDVHANADKFGLGAGVYPKDNYPIYPAHPNCKCYVSRVYDIGTKTEKSQIRDGTARYIDRQTAKNQQLLLGIKGRKKFLETGAWEGSLRNYNGHEEPKPRISKKDLKTLNS